MSLKWAILGTGSQANSYFFQVDGEALVVEALVRFMPWVYARDVPKDVAKKCFFKHGALLKRQRTWPCYCMTPRALTNTP